MKSTVLWALVAINALLLAALIGRVLQPNAAYAQARPGDNRPARPGDYIMVPGEVTGGSTSVVYVVDTTNGMLGALAYDDTMKRLETLPGRIDLGQVFSGGPAGPEPADTKGNKREKKY